MAMISLRVGSNTDISTIIVEDTMTPNEVFAAQSITYESAIVYLSGASVSPNQMNKSFADMGISGEASLVAVVKHGNG